MDNTPVTELGHQHKEAFLLMKYRCKDCGHQELIWNSRDGVTPFSTSCPSCGNIMSHTNFLGDTYAPNHKPHHGQRVWINMTLARARTIARNRVLMNKKLSDETERLIDQVANQIYANGHAPDVEVTGYEHTQIQPTANPSSALGATDHEVPKKTG